MPVPPEQFLATVRRNIEARVREQIERHQRVDPNCNIRRVVEIQMQQEREKLERLIENNEEESPAQTEALFALLAWLPQLENELKNRSR
jgi:hypothetical protein